MSSDTRRSLLKTAATRPIITSRFMEVELLPLSSPIDFQSLPSPSIAKPLNLLTSSRELKLDECLFVDLVAAISLSRVAFVILAESQTMSIVTIQHFVGIFVPLCISQSQILHTYSMFDAKLLRLLFTIFQILIFFGLGWYKMLAYG